jgi:TPR repeat protein
MHNVWKDYDQAIKWATLAAEAELPIATFNIGVLLERGEAAEAPDYRAAAGWYRRAANAGDAASAFNLCTLYTVGRGRAWQIMPATSHRRPSIHDLNWRHMTWRAISARP